MTKTTVNIKLDFYRFVLEPETKQDIVLSEAEKDHFIRVKFHREFYTSQTLSERDDLLKQCDTFLANHYGAVLIYQENQLYYKDNMKDFFQDMVSKEHIILDDNLEF